MAKLENEVTVSEAVEITGAHADTVRTWAKESIAAEGKGTHLRYARVESTRKVPRYYLDRAEVVGLTMRKPSDYL